ncbi:MAG: ATP-grasp domain-containing protein [Planctomycetota bacterium]|nr:ATP-grasp domain-containing protein [Planctomycetota bacterium]
MTKKPSLALIDLSLTEPTTEARDTLFDERRDKLKKLGDVLGFQAVFIHPADLLRRSEAALQAIEESQAAWWFGRIPEPLEAETLWRSLVTAVQSFDSPPELHEDPDWIDEAFSVKRFFAVAAKTGVPQAQTQCVDLPESFLFHSPAWIKTTLRWRLRKVKIAPEGAFVRSYMGTTKVSSYLSIVRDRRELISRSLDMLETLRGRHKLGGLAIRELLPISLRYDKSGYIPLSREYRVFIVFGRPVFWSADVNLYELSMKMKLSDLEDLTALSEEEEAEILSWSHKLGLAFQTRFLVADFAVLVDGSIALIETNPGITCGWAHEATLLGAYGPFLAQILKLSWPEKPWSELASAMGLSLWGQGKLFNFVASIKSA